MRRAYYHCAVCKRGIVPRDGELGVTGASLSPGLRSMVARAAAAEPFAKAADLLAELAGIRLSAKRIERCAESDGAAAAARTGAESIAIAHRRVGVLPAPAGSGAGKPPDKLYIAIDGTGVPMVPAAVGDRAGKSADGRARTREVKLACLFTQTTIDEQGRPVRDPDSTSYLGSFAPAAEFATLVHAEARRRGADRIRQLVVLGDGAPWIWNLATAILPEATPIVDIYHAREHLHAPAAWLTGVLGDDHPDWLAARLADLDNSDIEALVAGARRPALPDADADADADERDKALNLLPDQRPPDALRLLPRTRHVRRLRHRRSRLQGHHRAATQTVRHALEHSRRHRHPHPALPGSQRPLGPDLAQTSNRQYLWIKIFTRPPFRSFRRGVRRVCRCRMLRRHERVRPGEARSRRASVTARPRSACRPWRFPRLVIRGLW